MQPKRVWVIGGSPECDVVDSNPTVSARHCLLAEYDQGFAIEDLGTTNGTYVNGQRLTAHQPVWVSKTDAITLGRTVPMRWPQPAQPATPGGGRGFTAPIASPRRVIRIGRGDDNDQVLDYPMISWNHACLIEDGTGRLLVEDLNSRNGTAVGAQSNRIAPGKAVEVSPDSDLYFGSFKIPVRRLLGEKKLALGNASGPAMMFSGNSMALGRDPTCDYPLDYPMISWRHAELTREAGGIYVRDLGSRNGTFVDGVRISGKTLLNPGSEVALGSYRFTLVDAAGNLQRREYNGNVTIESVALTVDIKGASGAQRLLEPVSLTIFPSEMVAVMGPAGAGKTTLMKALNGYSAPTFGRVLFNGSELYKFYDQFRLQLGYVPQDDIMHPLLTVQEALYFTAKLRTDLKDSEIRLRIQDVLTRLNIDDIADRQIGSPEKKVISGGQRKRLNIAMELLSDPNVLFLDEPTTGLSSYDAFQVVKVLRQLADTGKTVVLTIHQPSIDIFKVFDNLAMVSRDKGSKNSGSLAYYGPAFPDSIQFFSGGDLRKGTLNPTGGDLSPELLLDGLSKRPTAEWVDKYNQSKHKQEFVDARAGQLPSAQAQSAGQGRVRNFGFGQWWTLFHRNGILRLRDRGQVIFMALQATAFPLLMCLLFHDLTMDHFNTGNFVNDYARLSSRLVGVHFLLVVAAIWFGVNNAARDIVGEWSIYLRERMVSLKLPSYVFAKLGMLAAICLLQCTVLLAIVYPVCKLESGFGPTLLTLFVASQVGAALGLLISSFAKTTEAAIAVLPIPLLFMILLSGGIKPLEKGVEQTMATAFPSRWAFEANIVREANARGTPTPPAPAAAMHYVNAAQSAPAPQPELPDIADKPFPPDTRHKYGSIIGVLTGMIAVLVAAIIGVLKSRDIQ
jgi:ABC transport system ATP-binding/permease protein